MAMAQLDAAALRLAERTHAHWHAIRRSGMPTQARSSRGDLHQAFHPEGIVRANAQQATGMPMNISTTIEHYNYVQ